MPADLRGFDQFVGETDLAIKMLLRFLKSSERGIQTARAEEKAQLDARAAAIEGEFIAVIGAFIEHHEAHQEEIPRLLRYSHVFAIYSLYERELDRLCKEIGERRGNLPSRVEDQPGYPKLRAHKKFLTEVVDAAISVWDQIETVRLVRNCIAHGSGFVDAMEWGRDELLKRIPNAEGVSIKDGRLQIEESFVENTFNAVSMLFTEAFENMGFGQGWYQSKFSDECAVILDEENNTVRVISDDDEFEDFLNKTEEE